MYFSEEKAKMIAMSCFFAFVFGALLLIGKRL